jgi:divalent metal cation (Fe/Co/Zn/Cd) transporter
MSCEQTHLLSAAERGCNKACSSPCGKVVAVRDSECCSGPSGASLNCDAAIEHSPTCFECSVSWLAFARSLALVSVLWNVAEGGSSLYAGAVHRQVALLAYGGQSVVEIISASIVWWRLSASASLGDRQYVIERERKAVRAIGVLFVMLAMAVVAGATVQLVNREGPSSTFPGLIISSASALAMFLLYVLKLRAARVIHSDSLHEDALCSRYCLALSVAVVVASAISQLQDDIDQWCHVPFCNFWWLDASFALVLSVLIFRDGIRAVRQSLRPDFDGGCGCSGENSRLPPRAPLSACDGKPKLACDSQRACGQSCG